MNDKQIALAIAGVLGLAVMTLAKKGLVYFTKAEFGAWYPLMSRELLTRLDLFRELMGSPVHISPVDGALGRHGGESDTSQHNVDKWGEVLAVDVFPTINGKYVTTEAERRIVLDNAKKAGFTGIGIYTDTSPGNLLHVDVRKDRTASNPALWARVNGEYGGMAWVV